VSPRLQMSLCPWHVSRASSRIPSSPQPHRLPLEIQDFLWKKLFKIHIVCWALMAPACNPSCLGGRDQEDDVLRPARAKKKKSE
jgi:hypothetical protein